MSPASWLEKLVGETVAEALGPAFRSVHLGGTDQHDCSIYKDDKERAILEVTEDCDETLQASNAHAYAHPEDVIRGLRVGSGEWAFAVDASTRVARITDMALQAIVDELTRSGLTRYDSFDPSAPPRSESCAQVGAHSVFKVGNASDRAHLVFARATPGSLLRSDPDLLADYAMYLLDRPLIQAKVGRLVARAGGHTAWLAVVVSTATPGSVYIKMTKEASAPALPSKEIFLPDGLDGIWIVSGVRRRAGAFLRGTGWRLFEFSQ